MKKLYFWILSALLAVAAFFSGFFLRQPKINKLKKQFELMQKDINKLETLRLKQKEDFQELLIQHKSLKAINFKKRAIAKEKMRGNLIEQYALKEYIDLLILRVREHKELSKEELMFFNAYEKAMNSGKTSSAIQVKVQNYITSKYETEIKKLKECDSASSISDLNNIKVG